MTTYGCCPVCMKMFPQGNVTALPAHARRTILAGRSAWAACPGAGQPPHHTSTLSPPNTARVSALAKVH